MNLGRKVMWSLLIGGWAGLGSGASAEENLAVDASFESPLPSWFAERSGTSYYAGKERVDGAADGRKVLAIEAWDQAGSRILSAPIHLKKAGTNEPLFSATTAVRSFGQVDQATVELALFDEKGTTSLASFGQVPVDGLGTWQTLSRTSVKLEPPAETARLGLVVRGPQEGARVEVDLLGLFPGRTLGRVEDNSDFSVFEAEELADGKVWKAVDHYGGWYNGLPNGMKMLAGFEAVPPEENRPLSRTVPIRQSGPHTLWVRFCTAPYAGQFTVSVRQNGAVVAEKRFDETQYRPTYTWLWDSVAANLQAGEAEIVLTRPASGASWVTRKIDLFVLTNQPDYVPQIEHFHPQGYLRFTNLSEGAEPFCLWIFVRRHQGPQWYANPGMLSRAGLSESYYVPEDRTKWLGPGQSSPWVRVSDYLLAAGGRNNVQLIATRQMHTTGFVTEPIQGRLEFAWGDERTIARTIEIHQEAPRLLMTWPYDFQTQGHEIKTALDYIRETEQEIAQLGPAHGKLAQYLNLTANLSLQVGVDDPSVIQREIEILKRLGFNGTYHLIAPPERAVEFYEQNGLVPRFGVGLDVWRWIRDNSQHHPDTEKMERYAEKFATDYQPILDHIVRSKLMDEPGGMSYEEIVQSEPCREKFVAWLRDQGLTPTNLGVQDWAEVRPVLPWDSDTPPELFYYTSLFRLEAFATLARACVQAKRKHLPASLLTYVNYSLPTSGGSWTERGTDLFLAQRHGGLEMVWTEDWLGWSAGPQHLSDTLALARAAGRPENQSLGAYWVGQGTPTLMRLKFYTLLAGGVRNICCYDYGPWYAGIDSWGRNFELYSAIRDCNLEVGAIDEYCQDTVRRPTDIAILSNRTAYLWEKGNNACEQNASYTHWALAHAGYDADFLPEEDVEKGYLAPYKVLYLDGPQIRRKTAQAIAVWVEQGGVLFASAGAASRDEFDRPLEVLEEVCGAKSQGFEVQDNPSRPMYELRALKPLDTLIPTEPTDVPTVSLPQLCFTERLEVRTGAKVILTNQAGQPAGVVNPFGKGTAIRVAALPGLTYLHEALQPPYDPTTYLPRNFRTELRDFLAWPAKRAGAARVAEAFSPIAEIVRYDGPDRAVVFVIDHRAEPTERFQFKLFDADGLARGLAATGVPVELQQTEPEVLTVSLPLHAADAVVLLKD